jgi:hypothetical protein
MVVMPVNESGRVSNHYRGHAIDASYLVQMISKTAFPLKPLGQMI